MNLTAFNAALKEHYTGDRVEDMTYRDFPFFAMLPKMENFGGKSLPIPIIYGRGQGRSKTFSIAQSGSTSTASKIGSFQLTRVKDYAIATLDGETMAASKGDANAFMSAFTTEVDGAINSLTRSIAIGLVRTSAASIGQVNAEPTENATTFQITLKDVEEIVNFELQQVLVIYSALSGGSQRNSDGSAVTFPVVGVNRSTGVLTLTGSYTSSGTIAANDYIFAYGDRGLGISGLEDWCPSTAPGATSFFGVDRSVDTRLGGLRLDGSGAPIEEVLIEGDRLVGREGHTLDHYFMNFATLANLKKALGTKVQYVDIAVNPRISFRAVMVDGNKGPIKCIADNTFPSNRIFGLKLSYCKLYSIGKAVSAIDDDGLDSLRQAADDGVELRYSFYGNFATRAPGAMINIQI
jgi:hypothetical protein